MGCSATLLEPRSQLEGSYEIGAVRPFFRLFRPSFRLSVSFLGIGSLVFSET